MEALAHRWRQYRALFLIYLQDGMAYRAQGVIWVLTDAVTALIMPQVWLAAGQGRVIAGYSPGDIVVYYLAMLLLTSFITSHFMWDISWEIREGTFSIHLLRPIHYMEFMLVRNFTWRLIRTSLFLPFFLIFLAAYWSSLSPGGLYFGWEVAVMILLGHLVSLTLVTALAMVALFTEEAQSIFEVFYFPALFLSGQIFPIDLMPDWVKTAALWTPFYYTVAAPTELLMGKMSPAEAIPTMAAQAAWIGVSLVVFRLLFQKGMKSYSAVGM